MIPKPYKNRGMPCTLDVYKRQVLVECGKMLEKGGYIIKSLNTINFRKSMHYNPCLLYTSRCV